MRTILATITMFFGLMTLATNAKASQCWQVNGWNPPAPEVAVVTAIPCTHTPTTHGWIPVGNESGWYLRVALNDPHVFTPWVFHGSVINMGTPTAPVFQWDPLSDQTILPWSPDQATPVAGLRVRIRDYVRNRCFTPNATNGGQIGSAPCTNAANMVYTLVAAGGGKWRFASEQGNKCPYVILPAVNGGTVRNWGCWSDPNMAFGLEADGLGGFRLRHQASSPNQCPYDPGTGLVHHWVCWNDLNMSYRLDAI